MTDKIRINRLIIQMRKDTAYGHGLSRAAVLSITDILEQCIGAPIMLPTRRDGTIEADRLFPGSPDLRHAFNWGVKWACEQINTPADFPHFSTEPNSEEEV